MKCNCNCLSYMLNLYIHRTLPLISLIHSSNAVMGWLTSITRTLILNIFWVFLMGFLGLGMGGAVGRHFVQNVLPVCTFTLVKWNYFKDYQDFCGEIWLLLSFPIPYFLLQWVCINEVTSKDTEHSFHFKRCHFISLAIWNQEKNNFDPWIWRKNIFIWRTSKLTLKILQLNLKSVPENVCQCLTKLQIK